MTKGLYIKTYGCQMNVYDSDRMADVLAPHGYGLVGAPEVADLIILNTCHIREKAAEKVYSELGRLKTLKMNRQNMGGELLIAVAGCVAQAEGEEILRRAPYVDIVLGPQTYHDLPEMIAKVHRATGTRVVETDFPVVPKFDTLPSPTQLEGASAFLTVQEGCDKFCTFCCVPYTRGAEFSRPVAEILSDAKALVAQGVREIMLLGQNVSAFHGKAPQGKGEWGLGRLIREVAEIDGLDRIRYTTSHPRDMQDELISCHRDVEKLMPYLHLPIQSGADPVLKRMNRKHSANAYREVAARFKEARPDIVFSSDFIVGFPGETDQDFADTLKLVRDVGYGSSYSFKYSPRPGTPGAMYEDQVEEYVKDERLTMLQQLLAEQKAAYNASFKGKVVDVLFDKQGREDGQYVGYSPYLQPVIVNSDQPLLGELVPVYIEIGGANSLAGKLAPNNNAQEQPRKRA